MSDFKFQVSAFKGGRTIVCNYCYKLINQRLDGAKYCSIVCKNKVHAHVKRYRLNNKEKVDLAKKLWQANNKEKVNTCNKRWRQKHKLQDKLIHKSWYERNKEKFNLMRQTWRERNRERDRFSSMKRKASKRDAVGVHFFVQWQALKLKYGFMCLDCGKYEPEIKLTEDHIIPLLKGGINDIANIQPLCQSCNSKKGLNIKDFRSMPEEDYGRPIFS